MFQAAPMESAGEVRVHLLSMTEDPLGAIAAACRMYEGKPTYKLSEISAEERMHYAEQVQQTHLKAPLEFVKFHFFIEGVPRDFTHQMVRQRTAVFAQESMRFAVKDNMAEEAYMPPSIEHLDMEDPLRQSWFDHMHDVERFYNFMIANGIPAEDARAILPHNTTTRLHYATDLRNLSDHAGNRLCTQAQFIWRDVFNKILLAIRNYSIEGAKLASLPLFKPVCYQVGKCPFKADFDRGCTIRDRADAGKFDEILDEEWMFDEKAAWQ
jgi:flavin-dependent thymidylate synthase